MITKYLTKEGKRWSAGVDTLYAPMIWDGCHWIVYQSGLLEYFSDGFKPTTENNRRSGFVDGATSHNATVHH